MPGSKYRVTVLGDLMMEFSTKLAGVTFRAIEADMLVYPAIKSQVGGAMANFALAAVNRFAEVTVLGCVGGDAFGSAIVNTLRSAGARVNVRILSDEQTGLALNIRDTGRGDGHGNRLLLVERGANARIDSAYIEEQSDIIAHSDLFFLDGYNFLTEDRRAASECAMSIAARAGVKVALDVVPHEAHKYFRPADLERWRETVSLIVAEVRTVRTLLGLPWESEIRDEQKALDTWGLLHRKFPGLSCHLRFGAGHIEQSLICEEGRLPVLQSNSYVESAEPRGFGDRLSAADLADYLAHMEEEKEPPVEYNRRGENK